MTSDAGPGDLQAALDRLAVYAPRLGDRIYHWVDGEHIEWTDGWGWTDGFWPGLLWLAYESSGNHVFADFAARSVYRFKERLARPETLDHDLGFLYSLAAVSRFTITGDPAAGEQALGAARSLAARFNAAGKFIQAWNAWPGDPPAFAREKQGKAIIDCLMNLPLLWWAAAQTGNEGFAAVAHAHAQTVLRHFFRPDGATYHTFNFDPVSGAPLGPRTWQGYADESAWARGNAWTLYGFALAYTCAGCSEYLAAAQRSAAFWLARVPAGGVPPWDFDAPPGSPPDTSAAAIAACGLQELARYCEPAEAERYRQLAGQTLRTLAEQYAQPARYIGLLTGGTSHMPKGQGVGVSLIYGDYFYVEALQRALGRTQFYWWPAPAVPLAPASHTKEEIE